MHTAIVTDTNSGMSVDEGNRRGIFVIPMPVIVDGDIRLEGLDITYDEIFHAMAEKKNVTTSQPSQGEVLDLWQKVIDDGYDELVYIPMSSGLSSSCASAKGLAEEFGGRVHVVDNHRISLTLYESVLDAKALADKGWNAVEIKERLENQKNDATIYLTVNSIDYLKKSGRITDAAIAMAKLFKIKPVLTIQGEKIDAFAKTRGILAAEKEMLKATFHDLHERFSSTPKRHILVGAAGTLLTKEEIERWSNKIKETFPGYPYLYHPLSCSIACHTGPGAMATGFVFMDRGWDGVGEG